MCQMFKHRARACRGIRHGAGCRKETRQLQDRCRRRGGALWGGWTPNRASDQRYAEPSREK